jgi:hypothetical protein
MIDGFRYGVRVSLCALVLALGCGDDGSDNTGPGPNNGENPGGDGDGNNPGGGNTGGNNGGTNGGDDDPLTGDYWMRTDMAARIMSDPVPLIGAASIRSDVTAYSLVRVVRDGDGYQMIDWQCHVSTAQACESVCTAAQSVARDGETKAYAPSTRTLTVQGDSWSASACAAATGWQYNCATDGDVPLPQSEDDPLVYDPAGGGKGVNVTATVTAPILGPVTCEARLVQRVDLVYEGSLANGQLATTGVATDNGSDQRALNDACGDVPVPVPVGPGTLRIVPAPRPISGGDSWECPSLAEFEQALPEP